MKMIKKVGITPIESNTGSIIDSHSTTDDKTKNTYSMQVIDNLQNTLDTKVNKKPYYFDNVAAMKAYNLAEGDYVITKGYYEENDGGNGEYTIINDSNLVDDGGSVHNLQNGLKAILVADDIVNIHQFGAKGDGTTDDTNAITNALTYANNIKGIEDKTYYITSSIQVTDKNISNLHIKSSPFNTQTGNTYFVVFVLNGENNLENVFVESEFEYTPSIDKYADPQTQTTGKASNVKAFRVISGETTFNKCKTNYCWSFDIYGTSKANIHNAICTNTEMSFYNQSTGEVKVYDSTFIINKLVDSGYYHHIYTKEATNMFFYNCKFEEVGTGNIGNHYHGYSTSFDPNEDTLGYLEINNCTLITSTDAGQLNAVNLVVNGGSIECSKLTTGGDYIDSPKASFNNVYIKMNNNSNTTLSNCKTTIDNCIIDITASGTKKICKFAYKLLNSIINILTGTLGFDCEIATSSNILNDEVVVSNNTINTDSISWLYPPYASNIKISNNTYNLGTLKTTINPTDRSSSGYVMNCIFKNWTTPLNANSSNGLKYRYIADGILKSNITDNTIPSIPTKTSDLTNDSGFITNSDLPTNYVTTNTQQNITGEKTFTGEKKIKFKQGKANDKCGFTIYDNSNEEIGYLEGAGSHTSPSMRLGVYDYEASSPILGFEGLWRAHADNEEWSRLWLYVPPKFADSNGIIDKASNTRYLPLDFTNGTNHVQTDISGTVNVSSLLPTKTSDLTNDSGFITNAAIPAIVDNLNTNDATKTLSAKQGKRLKDSVELLTNSINGMQETLVSGTNIKTINNESILGSGNITIEGGGSSTIQDISANTELKDLASGTYVAEYDLTLSALTYYDDSNTTNNKYEEISVSKGDIIMVSRANGTQHHGYVVGDKYKIININKERYLELTQFTDDNTVLEWDKKIVGGASFTYTNGVLSIVAPSTF